MKQLIFIAATIILASCGNETVTHEQDKIARDTTLTGQQRDSLEKSREDEEMSEHVIEGAFDALNR
mgnify:CR=1 FL=1